jgi:hypothetical protein
MAMMSGIFQPIEGKRENFWGDRPTAAAPAPAAPVVDVRATAAAGRPAVVRAGVAALAGLPVGEKAKRLAAKRAELDALEASLTSELEKLRGKGAGREDADALAASLLDPAAPKAADRRAQRERAAAIAEELAAIAEDRLVLDGVSAAVECEVAAGQAAPIIKRYLKAAEKVAAALASLKAAQEDASGVTADLQGLFLDLEWRAARLHEAGQVVPPRPFGSDLLVVGQEWARDFVAKPAGAPTRYTEWTDLFEAQRRRYGA